MKKSKLLKTILYGVLAICFLLVPSESFAIGEFDTSEAPSAVKYGMTPISSSEINSGSYKIMVLSSSSFFKPELSALSAKDGNITVKVKLKSKSYEYVFPGRAEDAANADRSRLIPITIDGENSYFEIPVDALNKDVPCAAYSIKRQKWYNRNIVLDASSLPDKALKFKTPNYDLIEKSVNEYISDHNLSRDIMGEKPKQTDNTDNRDAAKKILAVAFVVIIVGGILNRLLKRKRG